VTKARFMAAVCALLPACNFGVDFYDAASVQVDDASVDERGNFILSYRVPMETLYASPGIQFEKKGVEVTLRVVRCWIHRNCIVDAASDAGKDVIVVRMPGMGDACRVYLRSRSKIREIPISNASCTEAH